jgi:hypothetical protein
MTSAAKANRNAEIVDRLEAENARLHALVLDACKVFEHYDLPEHAFHYRRAILGLSEAKATARATIQQRQEPK